MIVRILDQVGFSFNHVPDRKILFELVYADRYVTIICSKVAEYHIRSHNNDGLRIKNNTFVNLLQLQ